MLRTSPYLIPLPVLMIQPTQGGTSGVIYRIYHAMSRQQDIREDSIVHFSVTDQSSSELLTAEINGNDSLLKKYAAYLLERTHGKGILQE